MPVETLHRFNVQEYYRMAETGVLRPDARVELLDGKVLNMSPIGSSHAGMVKRFIRIFTRLADGRWAVSAQDPVRLDEHSEPQPDFMVLKPSADDYTSRHPELDDVFLLVEVADASLDFDREEKIPAYGRAGILECWLVNLRDRTLEIYRAPHFTGYGSKTVLRAGDKANPQAFPDAVVDVAELLKR
jgi:Uma2 family endonuclease